MRPLGMASDLDLLPRRQLRIGLAQLPVGLRLEPRDLVGDIEVAAVGEVPQSLDLALELGNRLFEIKEMAHGGALRSTGTGARPLVRIGVAPARSDAAGPGAVE